MSDKIKLLCIAGATASGKSALALDCARRYGGEIVSADSMQIYRGMDIGTAKPTASERAQIPHHMIDICSVRDAYSLADWIADAKPIIADIAARGKLPIICGGTGLYIDTLIAGVDLSAAAGDETVRAELYARAEAEGAEAIHRELASVDPASAAAIHPNNVRRVIRAIEIYRATGITKTDWDERSREKGSDYEATVYVLERPRDELYARIDRRVDEMMKAGLEAEARRFFDDGDLTPDTAAGQAIGYKEFLPYFRGEATLAEAVDEIKLATRHYAKRQQTWFKRNKTAVHIDASGGSGLCPDNPQGDESPLDPKQKTVQKF